MTEKSKQSLETLANLCRVGSPWTALERLTGGSTGVSKAYRRVLEARIVADLLAEPDVKKQIPRITDRFMNDFASFDLSGSEGYLASLIDGRLPLEKVLLISTLGRFATLLALARLREKCVLTLQS